MKYDKLVYHILISLAHFVLCTLCQNHQRSVQNLKSYTMCISRGDSEKGLSVYK